MSFNHTKKYEPPEKFEREIKEKLSHYLHFCCNKCSEEEYDEIFVLLRGIEDDFKKSGKKESSTFDKDFKEFVRSKIWEKLEELKKECNRVDSNEEGEDSNEADWQTREISTGKMAKKILEIWYAEREQRPRAGIIFLYIDPSGSIDIALTEYRKNNEIRYGFPKGKIEWEEDLLNCAIRESAEETGLDAKIICGLMKDIILIQKNVSDVVRKCSIEHYYYIIPVQNKNIRFKPNGTEIQAVRWHNIFTVECCDRCVGEGLNQPTDSSSINYFMVNGTDSRKDTSLVTNILAYADEINGNKKATEKYEMMHENCR